MTSCPFFHATPDEAVTDTVEETILVPFKGFGPKRFSLLMPTSIDALLDHPSTHAAFEEDEYMPYWAQIWPSALMLGKEIAQLTWPPGMKVLEVGCGLGLSGLVALALGMEVVFSDYDVVALEFAARNAKRNGFTRFRTLPLDWRCPADGLKVPLILAADVIYEERNIRPLIELMKETLSPNGECWLADPDRPHREEFQTTLVSQGFEFESIVSCLEQPNHPTVRGTIYRIWREVNGWSD
ncbi:MAG: methyltransferase domain-containing protein [Leptolyngbya sp. SIO3F4]|nr:methyltransferase domain-containing protein [Leptolyngbya sp. SIO3F4]